MNAAHVIGILDDGPASLPPAKLELIRTADLLVGGQRHLVLFADMGSAKRQPLPPFAAALGQITAALERGGRVVVLASGDPLFYGIGDYLLRNLGRERVVVHPQVSSMALAFARVKVAWQDALLTSLHGRPADQLPALVRGAGKVGLFTDATHHPAAIARQLLNAGETDFQAHVCANLGGADEQIWSGSLSEMAARNFPALNVVILVRQDAKEAQKMAAGNDHVPPPWVIGIPDHRFEQRQPKRGLITKAEVRVLSLSKLRIRPDAIVWDIGTATASISIEAARLALQGRVYTIEKNADDVDIARRNLARFGVSDRVQLVHGQAPAGLADWPDPDAVFVGGTSGGMETILTIAARKLRPGGRIVANAATIENLNQAITVLKELGLAVDITLVQIARSKPILNLTRFESFDPVYIVTAGAAEPEPAEGDE